MVTADDCHQENRSEPTALLTRWLAALTIFLGSFLLFQVQPVIAKQVLPWFGGSASVWTTCLLFFQSVLFFGYVYAHFLLTKLRPRNQFILHTVLLLASFAALPVIPEVTWKPLGTEDPILRILGLLASTIGVPYFLLSATSPLIQGWIARQPGAVLPYRFYALSNLASLAALLAYPVLVEPVLSAQSQAKIWSALFVVFAPLCLLCARPGSTPAPRAETLRATITVFQGLQWLTLAAIPSILSLAVTNHLSQNVAPIPFLWILPLSVYLLSLILCFDSDGWYRRGLVLPVFGLLLVCSSWVLLHESPDWSVKFVIPVFTALLFAACMFFHGELALRRPAPTGLTSYYLMMSLGGALGAITVALGAPYLLNGNYETHLALAACAMFALFFHYRQHWASDLAWTAVAVATVTCCWGGVRNMQSSAILSTRDFYGALRIVDGPVARTMVHGTISHGTQFHDPKRHSEVTTYYAPGSGVERAIRAVARPGLRVGVIGLGVGTLAAYARPGDQYRFYELNPAVADQAKRYFTYLLNPAASVHIGDGRLTLEREAPNDFDVLVIDAFSGDSIPVHLLSRQAVEVYRRHLRPTGILAFHVSNSALNLVPVAARLAEDASLAALHINVTADAASGRSESDWVLAAPAGVLTAYPSLMASGRTPVVPPGVPVWTDDFSNLLSVLK